MRSVLVIPTLVPVRVVDESGPFESCELPVSALTRQMKQGHNEAWRKFHRHYYVALLRYTASRLGSANDAADVVQQVYLRVGRHIKVFDGEEAFWRWLMCVARCAAADYRRGARRRAALLEKFDHWRQREGRAPALSDESTLVASLRTAEALERLSPEDAELLRLKYFEEWSTQEIAAKNSTTPKAIENRLRRARGR